MSAEENTKEITKQDCAYLVGFIQGRANSVLHEDEAPVFKLLIRVLHDPEKAEELAAALKEMELDVSPS